MNDLMLLKHLSIYNKQKFLIKTINFTKIPRWFKLGPLYKTNALKTILSKILENFKNNLKNNKI